MSNNADRQNARISQAVKRHETYKESAAAKAETKARRTARAFKYARTTLKAV